MITADTITDEQIQDLKNARLIDWQTWALAGDYPRDERTTEARAHCAELLNARGGK